MSMKLYDVPKRPGGERGRGNTRDRAARKNWMGKHFTGCIHCGKPLNKESMEADKINPAGRYKRSNIQPSCRTCNVGRSNKADWQPKHIEDIEHARHQQEILQHIHETGDFRL